MTTIITDGNFLIADRRTSSTHRIRNKWYPVKTDDTVKIHLSTMATYGGKRVKAMAGAGDGYFCESYEHMLKSFDSEKHAIELETYHEILRKQSMPSGASAARILLLMEDATVLVFDVKIHHMPSNKANRPSIRTMATKPGSIVALGSGGYVWDALHKFTNSKLDAIDVFTFCTHINEGSSDSYSAYSLKEDHLYTQVNPTPQDVEERVKRVHGALELYRPSVKPRAL